MSNKSKFGLGVALGTVLGGIAAFFLSPNSGKENRKMVAKKVKELEKLLEDKNVDQIVKDIFGNVSEESTKVFLQAKKELIKRIAELKETIENVDKEQFMEMVDDVVKKVQSEAKHEAKEMTKLKEHLLKEWSKMQKGK